MEGDAGEWVEDSRKGVLVVKRAGCNDARLELVGALVLVEMSLEAIGRCQDGAIEGGGGFGGLGKGREESLAMESEEGEKAVGRVVPMSE